MAMLSRDLLEKKVRELAGVDKNGQIAGLRGTKLGRIFTKRASAPTPEEQKSVIDALGGPTIVGRVVPFVISTPERAADGHTLDPMGCDATDYARAPGVFWQHEYSGWRAMPSRAAARIGASIVTKSKDDVTALFGGYTADFSRALDGGFSYAICEIAALQGHRASVGFDIVEAALADEETRITIPWALDVSTWRLGEWSFVNFGADDNAISAGRLAGIDTAPIARALERFLDDVSMASGLSRDALARAWEAASDPARPRVVDLAPRVVAPIVEATTAPVLTGADLADAMARVLTQLG